MSIDTAREQIEIARLLREREQGAAPARLRRVFTGMGVQCLAPGRKQWWASEPATIPLKVERVLLTIEGKADFSVAFYGWRGAGLTLDFGIPQDFTRGSGGLWLHPMRAGVHIEIGKTIDLEVKNLGRKTISARAGLLGWALESDVAEPKKEG